MGTAFSSDYVADDGSFGIDQFLKPHFPTSAVLSRFGVALVALGQVINTRGGRMERGGQTFANLLMSRGAMRRVDRLSAWLTLDLTIVGLLAVAAGLILVITA